MVDRYLHMYQISLLRLSVFRSNEKVMSFYSHSVFSSLLFNQKKKKKERKKKLYIIHVAKIISKTSLRTAMKLRVMYFIQQY